MAKLDMGQYQADACELVGYILRIINYLNSLVEEHPILFYCGDIPVRVSPLPVATKCKHKCSCKLVEGCADEEGFDISPVQGYNLKEAKAAIRKSFGNRIIEQAKFGDTRLIGDLSQFNENQSFKLYFADIIEKCEEMVKEAVC